MPTINKFYKNNDNTSAFNYKDNTPLKKTTNYNTNSFAGSDSEFRQSNFNGRKISLHTKNSFIMSKSIPPIELNRKATVKNSTVVSTN